MRGLAHAGTHSTRSTRRSRECKLHSISSTLDVRADRVGHIVALQEGAGISGFAHSGHRPLDNLLAAHWAIMSGLKRLIPILDRVLVQKIAAPTTTAGGVLLPESAVQKVNCAVGHKN